MSHLTPLLGEFTARMVVRVAARRALERLPEQVRASELPALFDQLRHILNTLLGTECCAAVLEGLRKGVGL